MGWPPDPHEIYEHDRRAHEERQGQAYNAPPPPCSCGACDNCQNR